MNSKQRALLRSMANALDPIFQVGKGGVNENLIKQVDEALEKRELIKISILQNSEYTAGEASEALAEATGAESVQIIGSRFVLYRVSREHPRIVLERGTVVVREKETPPAAARPVREPEVPYKNRGQRPVRPGSRTKPKHKG